MDDNKRLCVMCPYLWLRRFGFGQGSYPEPLDEKANLLPAKLPGLLFHFSTYHQQHIKHGTNCQESGIYQEHYTSMNVIRIPGSSVGKALAY